MLNKEKNKNKTHQQLHRSTPKALITSPFQPFQRQGTATR